MDERSEPSPWERFLRAERRELELRRKGLLARLLNAPLPNESPEELAHLAEEDRLRAQAGLLELRMSSGEVLYKRLDELLPEDRAARANAERARIAWLKERHQERMKAQGRSRAAAAKDALRRRACTPPRGPGARELRQGGGAQQDRPRAARPRQPLWGSPTRVSSSTRP
jgi:hypothetical protein